jgi:ribosomal protein S18 acetylase RimI-like enzyme
MHNRMVQPLQTLATTVRPATEDDRSHLEALQTGSWGELSVAAGGRRYDLRTLPALVAVDANNQIVGELAYHIDGDTIEVVTISAATRHAGAGTMLLDAAASLGSARGLHMLWLVTTNDNLDALRFYQRRGLRILDVRVGGVEVSRRVKPSIPRLGEYGIPMRDEIILGRELSSNVEL